MKSENSIGVRRSIATKLLRIVFSVYLLVAVSLTTGQMVMEYRYQKSSVEHDLKAIQQTYEKGLAIDLWQLDDESLSSIIEGMLKLPVVVGIRVRNASGVDVTVGGVIHHHGVRVGNAGHHINLLGLGKEITALYDEHHSDNNNVFTHEFPLSYVHEGKTDQLGRVTLYSNSSVVFQRVKLGFLMLVVNAILKTVALWLIFLYFSKKLLRKPLMTLASAVESVSLDNLRSIKVDAGSSGQNELTVIENSFNSMIANLSNSVMERERATEALRESEMLRKRVFDSSRIPIVVMDAATFQYVDCNAAAVQVYRYASREDVVGKTPLDFSAPVQYDGTSSDIKGLHYITEALEGRPVVFEWLQKRPDGELWDAEVHLLSFSVEGTTMLQFSLLDITDRKRAEKAATLLANAKNKFVAVVSHELRSPLATIKEATSLVLEEVLGPLNDEQKEMLDIAKINISRLGRLVNNVLIYQKMDAGKMLYDFLENDVTDIIQEAYRNTILATPERKDDLVMNLVAKPPQIKCDKDKIMQVLLNLISNAIKYSERGPIVIETRLNTSEIEFSVRDSGQGIYPKELENIFMPFSHGPGRKTGGTGLGLAISKEIILAHNGQIWVESEFGKGSTFYFTLPF
jgi:PAS domain S-box-containing protein